MTSHEHESGTTKQPIGLNRRTLIRTGAHVAWAVPAVAMVTPAPAAAASGPAALSVTATNGGWTGATAADAAFAVTINVTNNNTAATTDLRVTFTLPAGVRATVTAPPGWTVSGQQSNVITLKRDTQLAGNAPTGAIVVTFKTQTPVAFTSIPVNITAAPGAPGTSGSTSTTVAARGAALSVTATNGGWTGNSTPNARFAITFNVTNIGTATATALKVAFTFPTGFTLQKMELLPNGWTVASIIANVVTLQTNNPLAVNASTGPLSATFDPLADADVGSSLPVSITATSAAPSTSGSTSTTVAAATPPALTLSPQGTWSASGAQMTLTVRTIGNTSLSTTAGLKVVLSLPVGLRDVTSASAYGNYGAWDAEIDPSVATTGIVTLIPTEQLKFNQTFTFNATLGFATDAAGRTGSVSIRVTATNPGTTDASGTATKK